MNRIAYFFAKTVRAVLACLHRLFYKQARLACIGRFFFLTRRYRYFRHFRIRACAARRRYVAHAACQNILFRYNIRSLKRLACSRSKASNRPVSSGQRIRYGNARQCQVPVVCRRNFIGYRFAQRIAASVCRNACRFLMDAQMAVLCCRRIPHRIWCYRNFRILRIRACASCRNFIYHFPSQNIGFRYDMGSIPYLAACARLKTCNLPAVPGQRVFYRDIGQCQVPVIDCRNFIGNRFPKGIASCVRRTARRRFVQCQMSVFGFNNILCFTRVNRYFRLFWIRACAVRRRFIDHFACQHICFGYHIGRFHYGAVPARF